MTTEERKVALVSGANKGIGRAIAAGLARAGWLVYLGARDKTRGETAAAELNALGRQGGVAGAELDALGRQSDVAGAELSAGGGEGAVAVAGLDADGEQSEAVGNGARGGQGEVRFVPLDVTSGADIAAAVARIEAEAGRLDALINNAGVSTGGRRPLERLPRPTEETAEDLRFVYETNVFAVVTMINAFLPLLRHSPAGRIVNVTSKRGSIGEDGAWAGQPDMAYSSSKTALNAITVHYARELAGTPIKVNGAAPGHVATDFNGYRGTRTPEEGAAVAIRLASLAETGPTGAVYEDETRLAW
jgi:NAD(P)-dependent dehydrogenase (short-subunit alcohol dehydrogenase family)